jgi:hypothetical protein
MAYSTGSFVELVSASSQLELTRDPYMPVHNFHTFTLGAIIIRQNYKSQ